MSSTLSKNMLCVSIKLPSPLSKCFCYFVFHCTTSCHPFVAFVAEQRFFQSWQHPACDADYKKDWKGEWGKLYCCVQMGIKHQHCNNQTVLKIFEWVVQMFLFIFVTVCLKLPHNLQTLKGIPMEEVWEDHSEPLQSAVITSHKYQGYAVRNLSTIWMKKKKIYK